MQWCMCGSVHVWCFAVHVDSPLPEGGVRRVLGIVWDASELPSCCLDREPNTFTSIPCFVSFAPSGQSS